MSVSNSGVSLSGVSATGAGTTITFTTVCVMHSMEVVVSAFTGVPGLVRVRLELSMDGSNWVPAPSGATAVITGTGSFYLHGAEEYPALYARANLVSIDAGVTVTLTATCASA